jgi:hypothetical protein
MVIIGEGTISSMRCRARINGADKSVLHHLHCFEVMCGRTSDQLFLSNKIDNLFIKITCVSKIQRLGAYPC